MNTKILAVLFTGTAATHLTADNLIWSDNFNAPDSGSFDAASLDGRRGGEFPTEIVARSARVQQQINNNELLMGGGRIRFDVPPGGGPNYNFRAGSAGDEILSGGGIRVEFDYLPTNATSDNWIAFSIGFPNFQTVPEPGGFRLNDAQTDFGFLLRNSGGTQYFKNGAGTTGGAFPATNTWRHVVIEYGFSGLNDLDSFTVVVAVDGTEVINQSHSWSNNSGQLHIELETNQNGTRVDDFQVFDLTPARLKVSLDGGVFVSSFVQGDEVGTLDALLGGVPGGATYELVAGDGDADNDKFQISGDSLQTGDYDFTGPNSAEGQQFSVRVRGTSTGAGGETHEIVLPLTISKDDDGDGLPDAWEIEKTAALNPPGNISDLSGDGVADFDGDGLTDLDEYQISLGISATYPGTYPDINPVLADSDGDGLDDREELQPGYQIAGNLRPPTDPGNADTDGDGLSDLEETNTFTFVDPSDTGTDPTSVDSDFDGLEDGFEVTHLAEGYNPTVDDSSLDTDGDTLTTADEVFYGTSVILADTDGDGLRDDDEIFGLAGLRPATDPTLPDSDFDGIGDLEETNTGTFLDEDDTGTNPMEQDTDGDGARDGFELAKGTDPHDNSEVPALPAGFSLVEISTDASSGISAAKNYTHAVSGGGVATVNGVEFDALTAALLPSNFGWDTGTFSKDAITPINNGSWIPADGGVTEAGLSSLLGGFTYSGTGNQGGSRQTFTLSGLTPGTEYDLRLYVRPWVTDPSGIDRRIDLTFTNGAQIEMPFGALLTDRPGIVLQNGNAHSAYYLSFTYTAQASELTVEALVPPGAPFDSGSFHMYALTNEVVGGTVAELAVTGVSRNSLGQVVIDFRGAPDTAYEVTKSADLQAPFVPLANPLSVMTNGAGIGQAIVPASETSGDAGFFRLED